MRHGRPHLTESRQRYALVHDRIARQARAARNARESEPDDELTIEEREEQVRTISRY